jgi:excinuclease UvrABC nuclease subunit
MAQLYRIFDADDVLLYVGCTANIATRIPNHQNTKPWWTQVARIEVEQFNSVEQARTAERHALLTELPRHGMTDPSLNVKRAWTTRRERYGERGHGTAVR